MTQYIKYELMILVPFLIGFGRIIKLCLTNSSTTNKAAKLVRKLIKTTSRIPYFLWAAAFFLSAIYGFIISPYSGWKLFVDALFATGLIQGSVVAWTAMGLYDTAKRKE